MPFVLHFVLRLCYATHTRNHQCTKLCASATEIYIACPNLLFFVMCHLYFPLQNYFTGVFCLLLVYIFSSIQLAWRHDSKAFIIVGNGFGSCIAMYSLTERNLELAWKVEAKSVAGQDADGSAIAVSETSPADVGELANTGKDFNYSDVFTMAEINPNSTTFAVEEKSDRSVFIHLISAGGQHLKQTELKEKSIVLLSTYNAKLEIYCIIVQGGNVLIVSATDVDVKSKFSVVRLHAF